MLPCKSLQPNGDSMTNKPSRVSPHGLLAFVFGPYLTIPGSLPLLKHGECAIWESYKTLLQLPGFTVAVTLEG